MGGNSKAIDIRTNTYIGEAEKINFNIFSLDVFKKDLIQTLNIINNNFFDFSSYFLWTDTLDKYFAGSTTSLFKYKSFIKYKHIVGDIDIMIDSKIFNLFEEFSLYFYTLDLGNFKYIGQDRSSFGTTFLSVFEYTQGTNKVNIQIDFEKHDFIDGKPTEWSKFSHSSSFEDLKLGLKGVHHKFLLTNITRIISEVNNISIATKGSTPNKIRLVSGSKAEYLPSFMAFSVDKGIRFKYKQLENCTHEGRNVYKEVPVNESKFVTEPAQIFQLLFGKNCDIQEYKQFNSTIGLCKLIKKYYTEEYIEMIFIRLLNINLFGKRAQLIDKSLDIDQDVKLKLVNYLLNQFKFLNIHTNLVNLLKEEYYKC